MSGNGNDLFEALIDRIADEVAKRIGQETSPTEPAMLSPRSIATILDCSVSEVRRYLQINGIPTVRFGKYGYRVHREEFEKRLARWKKGLRKIPDPRLSILCGFHMLLYGNLL